MKAPSSAVMRDVLRDAAWMTADRARIYGRLLLAITAALGLLWIGLSHAGLDATGKPLGTDFLSFWSASKLTLEGHAAAAYDPAAHAEVQRAVFPGADVGYYAFFYPPIFLLVCWPLALLPYGSALTLWLVTTLAAYGRVIAALLGPGHGRIVPILAFPAVMSTIGHGQNAFLSTALFGAALLVRARRPILAGFLFGALAFKPHLGLLIPVFLLAAGAWRTIAGAAVAVMALGAASLLCFGPEVWTGFLAAGPLARSALEQNLVGAEKMQSVFAAIQLWHGPLALAYAAQAVTALAAASVLVALVRLRPEAAALGPALVAASLLASPFLLDYDLTLLAIPLAWLFATARRAGFLPWEKTVLLAGFVLPLVSRMIAADLGLPLGPPVIAAVFLLCIRRGLWEGRMAAGRAEITGTSPLAA